MAELQIPLFGKSFSLVNPIIERRKLMGRSIYIEASELPKWIKENCPSAGPYPSISGMRKIWGQNSYIIKSGAYIYKVPYDTFWSLIHR